MGVNRADFHEKILNTFRILPIVFLNLLLMTLLLLNVSIPLPPKGGNNHVQFTWYLNCIMIHASYDNI